MTPATERRAAHDAPTGNPKADPKRADYGAHSPAPIAPDDARAYEAMDDMGAWAVAHPVECGRHP